MNFPFLFLTLYLSLSISLSISLPLPASLPVSRPVSLPVSLPLLLFSPAASLPSSTSPHLTWNCPSSSSHRLNIHRLPVFSSFHHPMYISSVLPSCLTLNHLQNPVHEISSL